MYIIYTITYIIIYVYYEELAHANLKTEKSHNLLSASWRPRTSGGIIQSEPEGLRTREIMV